MSCYHPITMFDNTKYGLEPDKLDVSFRPSYAHEDIMRRQGRVLLLPCRHCVGCRLDKSREWANRIIMEQLYHDEAWFLTLTYDDEHLPKAYPVSSSGEIVSVHSSLVKKDFQDFMKRLRKNSKQKLRYYAAGEYGSTTYRPHYHILVFGLHLDDLELLRKSPLGDQYFTSKFIEKCWPLGYHILGKVTWQSAAYVARYTMKKATHGYTKEYYDKAGIQPEFQAMSRKPGIGRRFYDDHPDLVKFDTFTVSTLNGGRKMTSPEYFRKLFKESNPREYVKSAQSKFINAEIKRHLKLKLTDKSYSDILKDEEEKQLSRLTSLIRDTV